MTFNCWLVTIDYANPVLDTVVLLKPDWDSARNELYSVSMQAEFTFSVQPVAVEIVPVPSVTVEIVPVP